MALPVSDLTQARLDGDGIFDVLMRANRAHLESEFAKNRIKGPEYATVYLGSLTQVLQTAVEFLLARTKVDLEAQLLAKQIALADIQLQKMSAELAQLEAQTQLTVQQRANLVAEAALLPTQGALVDAQADVQRQQRLALVAEVARTDAQTAQIAQETLTLAAQRTHLAAQTAQLNQQTTNLAAEQANVARQGALLEAQTDVQRQQATNLVAEGARTAAQTSQIAQEVVNLAAQKAQVEAQTAQVTQQTANLASQKLHVEAETQLTAQKQANAVTEQAVLVAQECKLRAEYDLTLGSVQRAAQETLLLTQKVATEKAQVLAIGVDADSVVGRQKALYGAQTEGFRRDAEQKAAKILVDSWNVRRTTDEATVADATNLLNDATVGRAVSRLLAGVGA